MRYYQYEVTDFLEDAYFKEWVYNPGPENETFWNEFSIRYPEKSEIIAGAKSILLQLKADMELNFPSDEKIENILFTIHENKDKTGSRPSRILSHWMAISFATAAMLVLLVGWLVGSKRNTCVSYQELISAVDAPLTEKTNNTSRPHLVTLPDSSTVLLHPNSSISYRKDFNRDGRREVYLSGQAFFSVTKNPDLPFFVYSNELITKVLGTSFLIKSFDNHQQVEVEVKTGKVSVYTRMDHDAESTRTNSQLGGVIITPNQKVLFSREEIRIKKSLVEFPEIIPSTVLPAPMLKFQDATVSQVFANLEQTYGIDIVYDEALFGGCLLTASFSNENLYEKIDLICKGIEARFEVVDARIVVSGRGCHQD
ncbi:FecR family protein [Dyadobacter sp. LHD-138]|uniref:FecR family protein n=1 Tax=Dyadobacter sp. LHD-138 TaxID=3071413 RepID=UPI0027DF8EC2|nr:FecR family protein [Dyadobacter sp. LHD-138]MDQ6481634.1 FecR family protein [Dyadobacter sp. LHD-138]